MKREIKIIGIQPYETKINDNVYVGTRYHYIYKEDYIEGNGCGSFKVPYRRYNEFPNIHVGDEYKYYFERTDNGERPDDLVQF